MFAETKRRRETQMSVGRGSPGQVFGTLVMLVALFAGDLANGQGFSIYGNTVADDPAEQDNPSLQQLVGAQNTIAQASYTDAESMTVHDSLSDLQAEVMALRSRIDHHELASGSTGLRTSPSKPSRRWFTTYENLLVQPLQSNSTAVIVQTADGYTHLQFPWELAYSPRIQIGSEAKGDAWGWRVRYWHFDHSESFAANDANGLIPLGRFGSVGFLSEEGDITTGIRDLSEGTFSSQVRTDVIDWELQRQVSKSFDLYTGIRYGKVSQRYHATTDEGNVGSRSEFRGIGPTVALRMQQDLVPDRLSLFANVRGSLLLGHKQFQADDDIVDNFSQSIGVVDLRSYADGMDTLAGNAEIQLGVALRLTEWFVISTALEAQHYGNVGGANPTAVFTGDDGGINGDGPMDDDIGFAGLSVGAEITW